MSWTFNPPPGWPVPPGWQPPPGWAPEPSWPPPPAGWQFWVPGRSEERPGVHEAPTSMAPMGTLSVSPGPSSFAPPPMSAPRPPSQPHPPSPPHPPSQPHPPSPPLSAPPGAEKAWHQRWWAIAGAVGSVFLVGCVLGGLVAVVTDSDQARGSDAEAVSPPGDGPPAPGGTDPTPGASDPAGPGGLGPGAERTGSGPAIVTLDLPSDGLHTVTFSYTGEGVFHARLLDQDGEFARGLGGGYGSFTGVYPLELRSYGQPGAIDIVDATGDWTVTINELSEAPLWPDQTTGSGPTVLRVDPDADVSSVAVSHQGSSNVFVWGHVEGQYEELMVNEIGEWSGEVGLRAGTFVIEIDADGEWSIEPG